MLSGIQLNATVPKNILVRSNILARLYNNSDKMAEATTYDNNVNDVLIISELERKIKNEIFIFLSTGRPLGELPPTIDFLNLYIPIYSSMKKQHGKLNGKLSAMVLGSLRNRLNELGYTEIRTGLYKHSNLTGGSRDNAIYLLEEPVEKREGISTSTDD
mgnify:CR=1 FL=1